MPSKRALHVMLAAVLCAGLIPAAPSRADSQTAAPGGTVAGPASDKNSSAPAGLEAGSAALLGRAQRASGVLEGVAAGRAVLVQLSDARAGWVTVGQSQTGSGGSFSVVWRATRAGRFTLRAVTSSSTRASASLRRPPPSAAVTVYAPGFATLFGPGLYGRRTACGTVLGPDTLGVAHRTLPCGTRVEVYYAGTRLVLPVIDRGPFVSGTVWDLTAAAARSLSFDGREVVGAIALGRGPVPAG